MTALDLSTSMLGLARERARRVGVPLLTVQGNVEAIPFPLDTFHQVVVVTVLCFVPEPRTTLHELARVLKPGESLVLGESGSGP